METGKRIETTEETLDCFGVQGKKKNRTKNDRRFSDEQIKLLEAIFESETRIEARKKEEVAKELGLQPRQVAIWFQNRRARWKSKQIEQDYRTLSADFADMSRRFETLKKEKQTLVLQLQKLNGLVDKECKNKYIQESKAELGLDNGHTKSQNEEKTSCSHDVADYDRFRISVDENAERSWIDVGENHETLLEMVGTEDASSASMARWDSFNSDDLFNDQSRSNSLWLDFWN